MTRQLWLSTVALLVVFLLGLAYILVVIVQKDPRATTYVVSVDLARSGGLLARSNVSYRGREVGRVDKVVLRPGGVTARVRIDSAVRIPRDSEVSVGSLSLAGEQYLDFEPRSESGPFLRDGDVLAEGSTTLPVDFSTLIVDVVKLSDQINPKDLSTIVNESATALGGTDDDFRRIVDHADTVLSGLETALPDTESLLGDSAVVLDTANDLRSDLDTISSSSRDLAAALRKSDPDARTLLAEGPPTVDGMSSLLKETSKPISRLLADLNVIIGIMAARVPAIGEQFPRLEQIAAAVATAVDKGVLTVIADISGTSSCDYGTPRVSPTVGGSPSPYIYGYCSTFAPDLLQRGAYFAPRPPGDETATAPPGVSPTQKAGPRP